MTQATERRREPRFRVNQPVALTIYLPARTRSTTGGIYDISEHGVSFTVPRPLDPGVSLTVEYEGCLVRGGVRHCRVRQYARQRQYLVGVAVTKVLQGEETWRLLIEQCCAGA